MLVFNQTKNPVAFEHGTRRRPYEFEAYGPCEVPEEVFEHMKAQRFPVSVVPVPSPQKAAAVVDSERDATRADELEKLKAELSAARLEGDAAKDAATAAEKRREAAEGELATSQKTVLEQTERASRLEADCKASGELLGETARKCEEAEAAVKRLETEHADFVSRAQTEKSGLESDLAAAVAKLEETKKSKKG